MELWRIIILEFTKRRNINRGYMKLDVWNNGIQLYRMINENVKEVPTLDYKSKAQILDSAQSISSNIAEGYCRKSINEYLYFLNVALGSCGELLTRSVGLRVTNFISAKNFDEIDKLHYAVENKLISLIKALQAKKKDGRWEQEIHEISESYNK